MEKIKIEDGSGDKSYFTIIPNYILNHSTIWDREVYIQMKRIAGENGTCWTSQTNLAKQCDISPRQLRKSLVYLLEKNWIIKVGERKIQTRGGEQSTIEYRIADLWELNNTFYVNSRQGSAQKTPPLDQRVGTAEAKGSAPYADKEEPIIKEEHNTATETVADDSHLITEIIKAFEEVNPNSKRWYGNKTQRAACSRLAETYGLDKILKVIKLLKKTNSMQYFPVIISPYELEDSWARLESALIRKKGESTNKQKIFI